MSLDTVLLRDEFNGTAAAGTVNGTLATDGANVRNVFDSTSKLSISGGLLEQLLGPSSNEPRLLYPSQNRVPGCVFIARNCDYNTGGSKIELGWFVNTSGTGDEENTFSNIGNIRGGTRFYAPSFGNTATLTSLNFYIALAAVGAFYFVRGGGSFAYPVLCWIDRSVSASPLFPGVKSYGGDNHTDAVLVAGYFLPSPLVSHGFTSVVSPSDGNGHAETSGLGSGGSGVVMSGTTWSVSGGKGINTPTLGSELVANGNMETGSPPTGWLAQSTAITSVSDERTGGGGTKSMDVANSPSAYGGAYQDVVTAVGKWYKISVWQRKVTAPANFYVFSNAFSGQYGATLTVTSTSWTQNSITIRAITTTTRIYSQNGDPTLGASHRVDDFTVKEVVLSSLLSLHFSPTPDVFAGIDIAVVSGTQVGLALNWDSSSSPANGVVAHHDGTNCKLEKCVAGVWTSVISAAATYSANARLVVSKIGTAYRLYYNNALVGSGTIADAGIINNALHGWFNTYEGNTVDNYACYTSGTSGEYATAFDITLNGSSIERSGDYATMATVTELPSGVIEHGGDSDHGLLGTGLRSVISAKVYGPSSLN